MIDGFEESNPSILISCAGLGMGNASRVAAVMEALVELTESTQRSISLHVYAWGSGHRFLREFLAEGRIQFELVELEAYASDFLHPKNWLKQFQIYSRNTKVLWKHARQLRPTLILLDSDYHFSAFWFARNKIVSIGQASDVLHRAQIHTFRPRSWNERFTLLVRERLDALLQGWFSNRVLIPSFVPNKNKTGKRLPIPLIARREFLTAPPQKAGSGAKVGILLSGSELESLDFIETANRHDLPLITPKRETVPSHATSLEALDIVFTQGGLSSISECIAGNKFVVVFPINNHPEQVLNAMEVERLGRGMSARIEDLKDVPALLRRVSRRRMVQRQAAVSCNGAEVAARAIGQMLWHTDAARTAADVTVV